MSVTSRRDLGAWVTEQFGVALQTVSSPVGLQISELVGLALRRNPRRAHLLVSTVLGKHVPVDPNLVIATGRLLGELVDRTLTDVDRGELDGLDGGGRPADARVTVPPQPDWADLAQQAINGGDSLPLIAGLDGVLIGRAVTPVVVLGFAETATSLGHLVADQLRANCYLHSTRRPVPGVEVAGTFEEGHSHATSHLLLPVPSSLLDSDGTLVLVDDELSTGRTAMGTITEAHGRRPRARYVLASLIDLRSSEDEALMQALATDLGCRIDVVSLVRGSVDLPEGLIDAVTRRLAELGASSGPALGLPSGGPSGVSTVPGSASYGVNGNGHFAPVERVIVPWPAEVPDGGRHGFTAADQDAFEAALTAASVTLAAVVRTRLAEADGGHQVVVVGTEELMYLPLRLAQHLSHDASLRVGFQSTTRSPVLSVDDAGYPIRRQISFSDAEGELDVPRFLYNTHARANVDGEMTDPDLVVVVSDAAADTAELRGAGGPIAALRAAGLRVELVILGPVDPVQLAAARAALPHLDLPLPEPLVGPSFGSYAPAEVRWLLTDLSDIDLEGEVADREAAIQAGTAHYAESLPVEFQPDERYKELFNDVLSHSAERLATAVGRVTELVLRERGHDVVLASLARAGTPIGILMRRWAALHYGIDLPHYALSIVRGHGIDPIALQYLAAHHDSRKVVFVDGWTGKGAITKELTAALDDVRISEGLNFNDDLAVLADPGYCVRTFGTRDDFLIASACLNSTVSGLVSRTVLNDAYLGPGQFHGAKFYSELANGDVSNVLLDTVAAAFPAVVDEVMAGIDELAHSDRAPTFAGWAAIESIRAEYNIESVNFVKPGVGETTRVLLRRVPWRILVREADHPDHAHLRLLAEQRDVPVDVRPDLPYSCVGLIRRMSEAEPGEG
ncbi:hypothetical protein ABIB25_005134 [Nakamurella sp. UYEF19]|uniref:phosphoribosyltransferase n=1 Tax=Nakamurella sp. UYEF19 TaxID=1756392 RepID=UPI003399B98B